MGSDKSEQVLTLLKELSVLKERDNKSKGGSATDAERSARTLRQQEIGQEIKALAEEKKKENPGQTQEGEG
jgi:hypothetical protein